jgi:competence protein ComFC
MLKSLYKLLLTLIDSIIPYRSDFEIVKNLTDRDIANLPTAPTTEYDWIYPEFAYKNKKVRAIIWELKYKHNTLPLDTIGRILYDNILALVSDVSLFDADAQWLIIPIPVSEQTRRERGYNQCEYICRSIIQYDTAHMLLYAPQWLYKNHHTARQSKTHHKEERAHNLSGCFTADPRVAESYCILIDDVVTTGSTLCEARKTLLEMGAKDVFAFTIAH